MNSFQQSSFWLWLQRVARKTKIGIGLGLAIASFTLFFCVGAAHGSTQPTSVVSTPLTHQTATQAVTTFPTSKATGISSPKKTGDSTPNGQTSPASDDTLRNILITFIVSLVGVIGTGVGVVASHIPTELTNKRDFYQRLTSIWKLLDFESKAITNSCTVHNNLPTGPNPTIGVLPIITTTAWQVTVSSGEFIAEVPEDIIEKLGAAYSAIGTTNMMIHQYTLFVSTSSALSNYGDRISGYYATLKKMSLTTMPLFQDLQQQFAHQIKINEEKTNNAQRLIDRLKNFGATVFIGTLVVSIILAVVLIVLSFRR